MFLGYVKFVKINLFIFNVLLSDLECFNLVRSVNSFSYNTNHKCSSIVISGGVFFFFLVTLLAYGHTETYMQI